jgi:sugar lactone lactonase YvrE
MKNYPLMKLAVLVVSALVLSNVNCARVVSDSGTETGNPSVSAMLYNPGGSPASHAKVKFYPIRYNPRTGGLSKALTAVVESTVTNAQGNYTAKLDSGAYNVLASSDSGVVYQDSIAVAKDSTIHPPADTLKAPGAIRGRVRLQPGDDARTAIILFLGTNTWGTPDDSIGTFTVANMAEGTYRVRFLTTLDAYAPKDTVLSVTAGRTDSLGHDIVLQYTGIPVVSGLAINYDTLKQIVTLTWNKPITGRKVAGYNIYRKELDSASFATIKSGVKDTVYSDSTGVQDLTYEYRVTAVDTNGTEGVKSAGVQVRILSYFVLDTAFDASAVGPGQFSMPNDMAIDTSDNIYVTDQGQKRVLVFNASLKFVRSFGVDTLAIPSKIDVDTAGDAYVLESTSQNRILAYSPAGIVKDSVAFKGYVYDFAILGDRILALIGGNSGGDSVITAGLDGTNMHLLAGIARIASGYCLSMGDSESIYVADNGAHRIQRIDAMGNSRVYPLIPSMDVTGIAPGRKQQLIDLNAGNELWVLNGQGDFIARTRLEEYMKNPGEAYAVCSAQRSNDVVYVLHRNGILRFRYLMP